MAQIRDVSKRAGVSPATVSRAFSDPSKLSEETLRRVLQAAEELDYKPNSLAKLFRGNRTNSVLVLVPELGNVFFARVLSGIERVAGENNMYLLVSDTHDDAELEKTGLELVEIHRADGVIQLGGRPLHVLHKDGENAKIPFVHAIEAVHDRSYPTVTIDNEAAAEAMTTYLLALGHRKIGVLAGLEGRDVTKARLDGYHKAIKAFGIKPDRSGIEFTTFSLEGGSKAAMRLLSRRSDLTALFCMSDEIAIGAMRAALDRGFSVPDDISITGFDNIAVGAYTDPPLTTVMQPAERIGESAMTLMASLLRGEKIAAPRQVLRTELVIRQSARRIG